MEIFAPDSKVMIKNMIIDAIVKSVTISSNNSVMYTVGWWNESTYVTAQLSSAEVFEIKDHPRVGIGFKK
jgi:hypothetical protein